MNEETQTELKPAVVECKYSLMLVRSSSSIRLRRKRSKVRRLLKVTQLQQTQSQNKRCYLKLFLPGFIAFALGLTLLIIIFNHKRIYRDFTSSYSKHYQQLLHDKQDYCAPGMHVGQLCALLRQQHILNQEHALRQLESVLHNNSNFNSVAITGTSGIGKSLWARNLAEHFQWRENVHFYLWNTMVNEEIERFHQLRLLVDKLSDCGRNLLIIDNLQPCDHQVVSILHSLIKTQQEHMHKHVMTLFIFKLNTTNMAAYAQNYRLLQHLPNTQTVNFRSFGCKELKDCIRREAYAENMKLNEDEMNHIMDSIDVQLSGCKSVSSKVLMYGKKRQNEIL